MCAWRNDHAGSLKRWIPVYSRPVDWLASEPGAFDHFQGYGLDTTVVMEITPDLVEPGKLCVPESDAHPKGFLLGTRAATRGGTIADVWWTRWDEPTATWTSPARQLIWKEMLGS